MNCWRVQNLLAPFLEEELPDAESEALASHLEDCVACRGTAEAVATLPELEALSLPAQLEQPLFEEFDRCLKERIAASTLSDDTANNTSTASIGRSWPWIKTGRGELRVPTALAAACLGLVVLMAGGIALNHQQMQDLQDSLASRDQVINQLQQRLAVAEQATTGRVLTASGFGGSIAPVFLPATAPAAGRGYGTPLPLTFTNQQVGTGAILPVSYTSLADGPRAIH